MCARGLARQGYHVVLADSRPFPRHKACAGLISARAEALLQEQLGDIPDHVLSDVPVMRGMVTRSGAAFTALPEGHSWRHTRRHRFDNWLAADTGAEFVTRTRYVTHRIVGDQVEAILAVGGERKTLQCRYLVGADGGDSSVRRTIEPGFREMQRYWYVQHFHEGSHRLERDVYYIAVGKKFSDLQACFCRKDGLICYGTGFLNRDDRDVYLGRLAALMAESFDVCLGERVRSEACRFSFGAGHWTFNFGQGTVLMAGEASGLLAAYGEGIPSALVSGMAAARSIHDALRSGGDALAVYQSAVREEHDRVVRGLRHPASKVQPIPVAG